MKDMFLTNYSKTTFLDKIKASLKECNSFSLSVSFIKKAGLVLIERELEETLERGTKGRIITSTYQNFTDIASLRTFLNWMNKYPNFKCHIDYNCFGENGFHSKGYLFEYDSSYEVIVGSSNITRFALLKNVEWNVSLHSIEEMESIEAAYKEYNMLWNQTKELTNEIIKSYSTALDYAIEKWDMDYFNPEVEGIRPNSMQRKALKELRRNRDLGVKRALVIAATGSGKTFLVAFDAKNYDAKKLLFVVHRDSILREAVLTFQKVFGAERSYGMYNGQIKDTDVDFLFASNTMMSKHLNEFDPNEKVYENLTLYAKWHDAEKNITNDYILYDNWNNMTNKNEFIEISASKLGTLTDKNGVAEDNMVFEKAFLPTGSGNILTIKAAYSMKLVLYFSIGDGSWKDQNANLQLDGKEVTSYSSNNKCPGSTPVMFTFDVNANQEYKISASKSRLIFWGLKYEKISTTEYTGLDTSSVKTEYVVGDNIDLSNIKLNVKDGDAIDCNTENLTSKIYNSNNELVENLSAAGTYKVVVKYGKYTTATYEITVSNQE